MSEGVLKVFSQKMTHRLNYSINDKGVCRTSLVTQDLLINVDAGELCKLSCLVNNIIIIYIVRIKQKHS